MLTQSPCDGEAKRSSKVLGRASAETCPDREAATKGETTEDRIEISSFVPQIKPLATGRFQKARSTIARLSKSSVGLKRRLLIARKGSTLRSPTYTLG